MPDGQVLEFTRVTKRFNDVTAVSDLSARVEPGVVTAFLGPNGAGKTTSLRILLGQVRATSGTATIGGVAYGELRHPLRTIGSVLEETVYRPRRSASRHLTIAAKANGIPLSRVDEVLSLVGLDHEAEGRVGSFSLGMRQRLSVAHALLGDPGALVFDEPANGLDPEGIRWMRLLMRRLADEGRTVLVSSHVLSEVEQVADHVLVLSKGQLVLSSDIETLADPAGGSVVVDSADRDALRSALATAGFDIEVLRSGLRVRGGDAQTVGAIAASAGVALSTLVQRGPTLEDVFIDLVRGGALAPRAVNAAPAIVAATSSVDSDGDAAADAGPDAVVAESSELSPDVAAGQDADAEDAIGPAVASVAAIEIDRTVESAPAGEIDHAAVAEQSDGTEQAEETAAVADDLSEVEGSDAEGSDDEGSEAIAGSEEPDSTASDDAPQSFDDILFGAANAPEQGTPAGDGDAPAPSDTDDASGVEVFDDLGEQTGGADSEVGDDDPRSAAVTSMLAAAARAYYEDEPADYPLGDDEASTDSAVTSDASESSGEDAAADGVSPSETSGENAHWSVASTGVIDQVPAWSPADEPAADGEGHETTEPEGHEGEGHEGEHREGEGLEGEGHEGEGHEHHEGEGHEHHEHHEGEGHEHHEGEHRQD